MNIPSFFFTYLLVFILGWYYCVLFLRFPFREMQHLKSVYVWNGAWDYPNGVYRGPRSLDVICLTSSSGHLFRLRGKKDSCTGKKKDCYLSTGRFVHRIPSRQYFCLTASVQEYLLLKGYLKYQIRFDFNTSFLIVSVTLFVYNDNL